MLFDVESWSSGEVLKLSRLLLEQGRFLESLVDSLPVGIAVVGQDRTIKYTNRALRVLEPDVARLVQSVEEPLKLVFSDRKPQTAIYSAFSSGSLKVALHPCEPGSALLICKEAQRRMAEKPDARKPLDVDLATLELVAAPVFVVDADQQILFATEAACAILGYAKGELTGFSYRTLNPDAGSSTVPGCLRHRTGAPIRVELREVSAEHRGSPVRVVTVIPFSTAVPERDTMDSLERVAGQIAHRMNNLLTVVLSYSELIASQYGTVDTLKHEVDCIHDAAAAASKITQDLLTFSGGRPMAAAFLNLDRVVAGTATILRSLAGEIPVRILPNAPDSNVRFGFRELETVLLVLVQNAKEAIGEAEGRITIETARLDLTAPEDRALLLQLKLPASSPHVVVSVSDTGAGFPAEHQALLFEPFFTTKPGALGLGLAVAYGLVKRARGGILVERSPGGGTVVHIVLPEAIGVE